MKTRNIEPILARALKLFSIFISGLIIVAFSFSLTTYIGFSYRGRVAQQRIHQDLGQIILSKLTELECEFRKIASIEDSRELSLSKEKVDTIFGEIQDIILILQNGGEFVQKVPANFDDVDEIEMKLVYAPPDEGRYFVEVLELLPRILDLENKAHQIIGTTEERLNETDPDLRLVAGERTSILLKEAETLFLRSRESANRIYYDSNLKMQNILREKNRVIKQVGIISTLITLLTIFFGGIMSYRVFQQISELLEARSLAETSLREAESRYRTVADFTYDWEYWRNPDGSFEYVSPACERITGYSVNHILSHPNFLEEIIYEEDTKIWEKHGLETEEEYARREIRFRIFRKDGQLIWIEHTCQPVISSTGEFVGYRASNREITERVEAENNLLKSEDRYRSLVENSPIGILLASPNGEILSVNKATLKILGSPSKEATKEINLLTFPPIARSRFSPDFQTCLKTGERVQNRMAYTSKWGRDVYARYIFTTIRGAKEELLGIQVLLEDITKEIESKNNLEKQIKNLASINTINTAIITRTDLERMIEYILEAIAKNLNADATDLLLFDNYTLSLTCIAQYGFQSPRGTKKTVLRIGEGYAGEAALKRKIIEVSDLENKLHKPDTPQRWIDEKFSSYFGIPLLVKGELKGILEVFHRGEEERDPAWRDFLGILAQQTAIAIDNYYLLDALRRSNVELELAYETTLEGWACALELRDYETKGHSERVTSLTTLLALKLGVEKEKLPHIRRGALLHDVGKIAISDTILLKPGPCTEEEWKLLHQHPQYGYDMLKGIAYLKPSLDIVLYHHERWDGSGYPRALAGERIPFSARIFSVIDVWDALTNDRPYHKAWSKEKTLAYIQAEAGKHFDPQVVEAFLDIMRE